jgi:hypothetical protein
VPVVYFGLHLRSQLRTVKSTVEVQKATIEAQAESMKAQSAVLQAHPVADDLLLWLEEKGTLGHSSVRCRESRYCQRFRGDEDA